MTCKSQAKPKKLVNENKLFFSYHFHKLLCLKLDYFQNREISLEIGRQGDCLHNRESPCQKGRVDSSVNSFWKLQKLLFPKHSQTKISVIDEKVTEYYDSKSIIKEYQREFEKKAFSTCNGYRL